MRGLCFRGEVATGGWGPERADEGQKMQVSSSIPWQLLGVAGGQSVLVLEPVESQVFVLYLAQTMSGSVCLFVLDRPDLLTDTV